MSGKVFDGTYVNGVILDDPALQNPVTITPTGYIYNYGTYATYGTLSHGAIALLGQAGTAWTITNLGTIKAAGYDPPVGVLLESGGSVTNGQSGTSYGLIVAGLTISGAVGTVTNHGTIQRGIVLAAGGDVTNSGTVYGGIKVRYGSGTVINTGTITFDNTYAHQFHGIQIYGPGMVTNAGYLQYGASMGDGSFTNELGGVVGSRPGRGGISVIEGSITNFGLILGSDVFIRRGEVFNFGTMSGVSISEVGYVTNGQSGSNAALISGRVFLGQPGTVTNWGTIASEGGPTGVSMYGGLVVNHAGALIDFVRGFNTPTTIINAGTIGGNTFVSQVYGTVYINTSGTVANVGSIDGDVRLSAGSVTNGQSGSLGGIITGFVQVGQAGTVSNFGTIGGVSLSQGGLFVNGQDALVSGGGVRMIYGATLVNFGTIVGQPGVTGQFQPDFADQTIINGGTIIGASEGIMLGNGNDRLVLLPGYAISGRVYGGAGSNMVEMAGYAGAPLTVDYNKFFFGFFQTWLFGGSNYNTLKVSNTAGTLYFTVSGFDAASEAIDLTAIGGDGQITNNDTANHLVTVTGSLGSVTVRLDATAGTTLATAPDGAGGTNLIACFCRGTLIRTPTGEVPVESLAIGDLVATSSGAARSIRWIGYRAYDGRFASGNRAVLPVRVTAGALAPGLPARDLWLSPAHSLFWDGVLVPVELLVNGASVMQVEHVERVEYFHIELDEHDIVFAEGAAAETFVDCDNRLMFANGSEYARLYPDDDRTGWNFCAPRLEKGASELTVIRAALLARAEWLGLVSCDPDLHLLVDGRLMRAPSTDNGIHRFDIRAGAREVWIASRSVIPSETEACSLDRRRLGVPVQRLVLYRGGRRIDIGPDCGRLRDGFHADEGSHRWTDGCARLPPEFLAASASDLAVEVQIAATELHYPTDPPAAGGTALPAHEPRRRRAAG